MSERLPLTRTSSDNGQWRGALAKLQSVTRLQTIRGVSGPARKVFADVSSVLFDNSLSIDALDKGLDSAEARCKDRLRGFEFVVQLLRRSGPGRTLTMLRKLTGLLLLNPTGNSVAEHYLAVGAAGSGPRREMQPGGSLLCEPRYDRSHRPDHTSQRERWVLTHLRAW